MKPTVSAEFRRLSVVEIDLVKLLGGRPCIPAVSDLLMDLLLDIYDASTGKNPVMATLDGDAQVFRIASQSVTDCDKFLAGVKQYILNYLRDFDEEGAN